MKPKIVCIVVGAVIGGWIGSSIGIPGFFGFIAGTLPLAGLGAYFGWRVATWLESKRG